MSRLLLFLTHEFTPVTGGAATYVREMARAAVEAGERVEVWAPEHPEADDSALPFMVRRLSLKGNQNWPDRLVLRRALREAAINWRETVVYLPEPGPQRLWIYAEEMKLPSPAELVLTLHGSEILRFARWPHRRRRFQSLLEKADRVGVVSTGVRDLLTREFRLSQEKIRIVPGGLPASFQPLRREPTTARKVEELRILTVGRIHPRKGQLCVLEAIDALPAELRDRVTYELVGRVRDAAYAAEIERFAADRGLRLQGPHEVADEALAARHAAADVFVLASEPQSQSIEGFGLVYLEAAACEVPVIGYDTGGVRDAIGPENGLIVPVGDRPALTRALAHLLSDPQRRARMGRAGPDWASRFSWAQNVAALFPPRLS
jgi:glycosyltransferase involved in cell wall biosynthesis